MCLSILSVVAMMSARIAAHQPTTDTSVLTSIPDQETSLGTVAMHDGPVSGELHFQLPTE